MGTSELRESLRAGALSSEELLTAVLRDGGWNYDGQSGEVSRAILEQGGGLVALAGLSRAELGRLPKIGPRRAAALEATFEIARRLAAESLGGAKDLLNEPARVKEYLRQAHGDGTQERTGALFLNARNRLLRDEPDIYRGTLDRAVVEPREVLKRGLLANAAGLVLYHNHPSGDPSPSREDREFTRRIATAAELVGMRLLDHVVIGRDGCVSFREAGLL